MAVPAGIEIAVLAKAPVPGYAKTRLIPRLGAEGAAQLQAALTRRAVGTAVETGLGPVTLWCVPDCSHPTFVELNRAHGVMLRTQRGSDLGARMEHAAHCHTAKGAAVLLMGTDAPALGPAHLRLAADVLQSGNDAVLFPAEDGGYVLIGLRVGCAAPFASVEWGSDRVMAQTRERLRAAGLSWMEPVSLWDLDRPEDLGRLATLEGLDGQIRVWLP